MHVSPPPHPAPLRDEQMDTVGGGGVYRRETKGRRKEFSISSPSFHSNTRHQAVPQTCQTNRWYKGVFNWTFGWQWDDAESNLGGGGQRWHCVREMMLERHTGGTNVISRVLPGDSKRRQWTCVNEKNIAAKHHTSQYMLCLWVINFTLLSMQHLHTLYAQVLQNVKVTFLKVQSEEIQL